MQQLAMPLDEFGGGGSMPHSHRLNYVMTNRTLTEDLDGHRVIYGLWPHLFGCWKEDPLSGKSAEVLPNWPVLTREGISSSGHSISYSTRSLDPQSLTPDQHNASNQAFTAFFSSIPSPYRQLASRFDNYQWLVLDLIWQVPEFAYVVDEADVHELLKKLASRLFCMNAPRLRRGKRKTITWNVINEIGRELGMDIPNINQANPRTIQRSSFG